MDRYSKGALILILQDIKDKVIVIRKLRYRETNQ